MTHTLFSQPAATSAAFFTPQGKVTDPMQMENETEVLAASFDLVARQDEAEKAITVLRSDVDEVKARLDRVSRAASRPALSGVATEPSAEVKGFVDGYLRRGRETEVKSISGVAAESTEIAGVNMASP